MGSILQTLGSAASGMLSQGERIRVTAENVANVDTPGYHRKTMTFESLAEEGKAGVKAGPVSLDRSPLTESFDPAHPMADAQGYVRLSNVDMAVEMADAREARRSYEANVSVFDQARRMYGGMLDLLRR
jgi:flagellar basal-body rod protein FlgC